MHKIPTHTRNAMMVTERISSLGIPLHLQQKIGAFAVSWGLFESNLERAVWVLKKENVKGVRPSTDKSPANTWVSVLEEGSEDLTKLANEVLKIAAMAAKDLMSYRHSLFHGYLVALHGAAFFIRNPRWNGEIRNRESGDAHIDENLLDLAIDAAWVLFRIVLCVIKASESPEKVTEIEAMKSEATRIRSSSNELRHISSLMNHEKY